ncbi:MAG: outer membrane lipid asymmetry maintenance protein MlaD [Sutterella sp.]|nr:outer membrane lipid asymmetry maintenance protein MlaD [Sutterella sp.]MDY3272910.1 outer membrane lipid asymmetry maintenance protein MlaD [Duodenibacillus sp.]
MKRLNLELMVGLFIVLGFAAFVFSALQAANLGNLNVNAHTYTVTARFDNIGGLKPRASVKSAGVVVGRVKSVTFDQETFQAKVEISVDSHYLFPVDSSLKILTSGLLGEQYIGISAGGEDENWKDGSVAERTQSAVVLENLIGQFLYQSAEKGGLDK